jgi:endonuclease/exonuclease/phosphatase family metal-dependent hydrolase
MRASEKIKIMSYNVEDLFLADNVRYSDEIAWGNANLDIKLTRIAETLLKNTLPDILCVQEVEDQSLLEKLNQDFLSSHFANITLIKGDDRRGIQVAIMSTLPLSIDEPPRTYKVEVVPPSVTRPILGATYLLSDKTPLSIFNFHFPSQFKPQSQRESAIQTIDSILGSLPANRLAVACGDSNVTCRESNLWDYLKHSACSVRFADASYKGTNVYENTWSMLDVFLIGRTSRGNLYWGFDTESFSVASKYAGQSIEQGGQIVPHSYTQSGGLGVSDHYPVSINLARKHP